MYRAAKCRIFVLHWILVLRKISLCNINAFKIYVKWSPDFKVPDWKLLAVKAPQADRAFVGLFSTAVRFQMPPQRKMQGKMQRRLAILAAKAPQAEPGQTLIPSPQILNNRLSIQQNINQTNLATRKCVLHNKRCFQCPLTMQKSTIHMVFWPNNARVE